MARICPFVLEKSERGPAESGVDVLPVRFAAPRLVLRCRYSSLYVCHDQMDGGQACVVRHLLLPELAPQDLPRATEQFFREGAVFQSLSHPGLPRVRELIAAQEQFFLVLEYFEGQTLAHAASRMEALPQESLLVRWMAQLADTLAYLHGQPDPIFYRGLCPDTIFVTSRGTTLLVDFGTAQLAEMAGPRQAQFRQAWYLSFAPPERFTRAPSNAAMDIYALGATFYTLATRKFLPNGWDRAFSPAPLVPMAEVNPSISPAFDQLVASMVNVEAAGRPQAMRDVLEALQPLLARGTAVEAVGAHLGTPAAVPPRALPPEPPPVRPPSTPTVTLQPPGMATVHRMPAPAPAAGNRPSWFGYAVGAPDAFPPAAAHAPAQASGSSLEALLQEAVRGRAAVVHLDETGHEVLVRHRVDGVVRVAGRLPRDEVRPWFDRLADAPGRLREAGCAWRVSVLRALEGVSVSMTRLDPGRTPWTLDALGLDAEPVRIFRRLLESSHGIVLVAGPARSGRTTTLYSALSLLCSPSRPMVTCQDTLEYSLPEAIQVPLAGLAPCAGHDVDVVGVDSIQDAASARTCIELALSGRLVVGTLAAPDCATAVGRLLDWGISSRLLAGLLRGCLAQHLVRRLCQACRVPLGPGSFASPGCQACGQAGSQGQVALAECVEMGPALRQALLKDETVEALGTPSLYQTGLSLVSSGVVAMADLRRVSDFRDERL